MNSKIDDLIGSKEEMASLVEKTRGELHKDSQKRQEVESEEDIRSVKEINTYSTIQEAISSQNFELREKYILAVSKDIKSRKRVRGRLLSFYIWFTIIVTACIFFVVVDPVRLLSGRPSFYPLSLKILLCGTFFANMISIIVLMIKYFFAPIDNFMNAFRDLGKTDALEGKKRKS